MHLLKKNIYIYVIILWELIIFEIKKRAYYTKAVSFSGGPAAFLMEKALYGKYHLFICGENADTYMTVKGRIAQ